MYCYRHYSEIQLENAVKAVLNDHLSLRRAALLYNVPRSTLSDHVAGKILPGAHSGFKSYLQYRSAASWKANALDIRLKRVNLAFVGV